MTTRRTMSILATPNLMPVTINLYRLGLVLLAQVKGLCGIAAVSSDLLCPDLAASALLAILRCLTSVWLSDVAD